MIPTFEELGQVILIGPDGETILKTTCNRGSDSPNYYITLHLDSGHELRLYRGVTLMINADLLEPIASVEWQGEGVEPVSEAERIVKGE